MNSLHQISEALRSARESRDLTQEKLRDAAGISRRTLTNVLSGEEDFRVSTLLSVADRLGLEVLLVPKGAARAVDAGATQPLSVETRLGAARRRIHGGGDA